MCKPQLAASLALTLAALTLATLPLAACGQQSSGTAPVTTPPVTTPPVTTKPPPVSPPPVAPPLGVDPFEQKVFELTNQARSSARSCGSTSYAAVPALAWNASLGKAARDHASDMDTQKYFDHTSKDGRDVGDRIKAAGYTNFSGWGENIAAGQPTPEDVVAGWLKSPGHCSNIMGKGHKDLGVGYVKASGAGYGHYWVQDFATR